MLVINYNLGENSRTIISDEVFSPILPMSFVSLLSEEEKLNPLPLIHEFFHNDYPLPKTRDFLNVIFLKASVGGKILDVKSLVKLAGFTKNFKKLLEASFWVTKKENPTTRVKTIKKDNLIPKYILGKSRKIKKIHSYLPFSPDPSDSLDPLYIIKIMFAENSIEELIIYFEAAYHHAISGTKGSSDFYQDLLLNLMTINMVLDSAHLIYVRTYKNAE